MSAKNKNFKWFIVIVFLIALGFSVHLSLQQKKNTNENPLVIKNQKEAQVEAQKLKSELYAVKKEQVVIEDKLFIKTEEETKSKRELEEFSNDKEEKYPGEILEQYIKLIGKFPRTGNQLDQSNKIQKPYAVSKDGKVIAGFTQYDFKKRKRIHKETNSKSRRKQFTYGNERNTHLVILASELDNANTPAIKTKSLFIDDLMWDEVFHLRSLENDGWFWIKGNKSMDKALLETPTCWYKWSGDIQEEPSKTCLPKEDESTGILSMDVSEDLSTALITQSRLSEKSEDKQKQAKDIYEIRLIAVDLKTASIINEAPLSFNTAYPIRPEYGAFFFNKENKMLAKIFRSSNLKSMRHANGSLDFHTWNIEKNNLVGNTKTLENLLPPKMNRIQKLKYKGVIDNKSNAYLKLLYDKGGVINISRETGEIINNSYPYEFIENDYDLATDLPKLRGAYPLFEKANLYVSGDKYENYSWIVFSSDWSSHIGQAGKMPYHLELMHPDGNYIVASDYNFLYIYEIQ